MSSSSAGGYPASIFKSGSPPAFLHCAICLEVARNPHRCAQEHVFCLSCITAWLSKGNGTCPMDRSPLSLVESAGSGPPLQVFRLAQDILNALDISCPHITAEDRARSDAGHDFALCQWSGKVKDEHEHSLSCPLARVPCEWKGCGQLLRRGELRSHMVIHDMISCPHCLHLFPKFRVLDGVAIITNANSTVENSNSAPILSEHVNICPRRLQKCPNTGCSVSCVGDEMRVHRSVCQFEIVPCPYAEAGCAHTGSRLEMGEHVNDAARHLPGLLQAFIAVKKEVSGLRHRMMHSTVETECLKLMIADNEERYTTGYFFWSPPPNLPIHLDHIRIEATRSHAANAGVQDPNLAVSQIFRSAPTRVGKHNFSIWLKVTRTLTGRGGTCGLYVCLEENLPQNRCCSLKAKIRVTRLHSPGFVERTIVQDCHVIQGELRRPNLTIGREYSAERPELLPSYDTFLEILNSGDRLEFGTFIRFEIV